MLAAATMGYTTATDLADYLVRQGLAFRDAHEVVGRAVAHAVAGGVALEQVPLDELREFSELIWEEVYGILDPAGSVASRSHVGGTAPDRVREAATAALKLLDARSSNPV